MHNDAGKVTDENVWLVLRERKFKKKNKVFNVISNMFFSELHLINLQTEPIS